MTKFERKNAYVNGLKTFTSSFDDAKEVVRFTVKNSDLHFLIGQLTAIQASGLPAQVDITHSEQTGKFGTFRGGSIKATAKETKETATPITTKNVAEYKNKRVVG